MVKLYGDIRYVTYHRSALFLLIGPWAWADCSIGPAKGTAATPGSVPGFIPQFWPWMYSITVECTPANEGKELAEVSSWTAQWHSTGIETATLS